MERLKILFYDIFTEETLMLNYSNTLPIKGSRKIYEQTFSLHRNIPDSCYLFNKIARTIRRLITYNSNCFGTIPNTNINVNILVEYL